jgi:hypothetical protein
VIVQILIRELVTQMELALVNQGLLGLIVPLKHVLINVLEMELVIQTELALVNQDIPELIVHLKHVLLVVNINLVILKTELVFAIMAIHLILKPVIVSNLALKLANMVEYVMKRQAYVNAQINGKEMIVLKQHVQQHYADKEILLYVVTMVNLV